MGPGFFTPAAALLVMGYWIYRVIIWPDAFIEAVFVVPIGSIIVWRFVRIGVWIDGGKLVVRNAWECLLLPLDKVELRSGYVDDLSEINRFTGGYTNKFRAKIGDTFAERSFPRHRLYYDGEQTDIDAFFGRTPISQTVAAERLVRAIEDAKLMHGF